MTFARLLSPINRKEYRYVYRMCRSIDNWAPLSSHVPGYGTKSDDAAANRERAASYDPGRQQRGVGLRGLALFPRRKVLFFDTFEWIADRGDRVGADRG